MPDSSVSRTERSALDRLLALYRPNVGGGNFQGDVAGRGANRMLSSVIVTLGLASEDEVAAEFRRLDHEHYERSEASIRKLVEEEAAVPDSSVGQSATSRARLAKRADECVCGRSMARNAVRCHACLDASAAARDALNCESFLTRDETKAVLFALDVAGTTRGSSDAVRSARAKIESPGASSGVEARARYLEACLRGAGFWETAYGWHNGTKFVGLAARPVVPDA